MFNRFFRRKRDDRKPETREGEVGKALFWNETLLKKLTESSPLAYLVVDDRTDEILFVNHHFCELWGVTHLEEAIRSRQLKYGELLDASLPEVKNIAAFLHSCNPLRSEEYRLDMEDKILMTDGRIISRFSSQIRDASGQYHGRLYIDEDISQRKNSEKLITIQRDLATKLSASTDLQEALGMTLNSIFLIDHIDVCGIGLLDSNGGGLTMNVSKGLAAKYIEENSILDAASPLVKLILAGKAQYGNFKPELFDEKIFDCQEKILSLAVIPIHHDAKVIGTLILGSGKKHRFNSNIQICFESLALQIGGTISRIEAGNALDSSQKNFKMLFDTINDFLFILDLEGIILKTNTVVERRLGYTAEELQQLHVLEIYPPQSRDEVGNILDGMLKGNPLSCEVPLFAKDGSLIPVETHVIMGKWDGNDVLLGISRDIKERQQSEEALRESEARWNFALEGSGDGVWDWNAQTDEVFYSKQWKSMIGYDEKEIGNNLDEWNKRIHPQDYAEHLADLNRHFNGETEIFSNEHRLQCKDGTHKWILARGKVVAWQPDGKPLRIIGTHSDVSSRKEFEESLRSAIAKEKDLNELKSRFVSMASHEFRTPLSTILMMEDSLMSYWKRMDDHQIASKLQNIKDQVLHLTKVVSDVMMVSKIQEGKLSYNAKSIDLVSLCRGVMEGFNADKHLKNKIQFISEFPELLMDLDSRLIVQVMNNLISNAIKYAQPNPVVKLKLYQQGPEIRLSIHDNGIGIPTADQRNLFQPFYRAENVKQIQGNGLGLNIVRESVLLHGGSITFDSKLGEGSVFVVHLPKDLIVNKVQ